MKTFDGSNAAQQCVQADLVVRAALEPLSRRKCFSVSTVGSPTKRVTRAVGRFTSIEKYTMANEMKTFRLKHRGLAIITAVLHGLLALLALISTVAKFSAYQRGEVVDWRDSWWVTALLFGVFVYLAIDSLRDFFLQLTVSKEGIWYRQLGSKRFIPWDQVESVECIRAFLTRKKQYYLMLNSEQSEDGKRFLRVKQDIQVIPLSVFVNRWLGSELRNEIKRFNPSLPMEEGLRNP